jgi:histone arginine demethylase JMJD6
MSRLTLPQDNSGESYNATGPTIRTGGIDRVRWDHLDRRTYIRKYLNAAKPVIIEGAIDHWPALGKWTPEFFRTHHGSLDVLAEGRQWKLSELIDKILTSSPEKPAPYLHNQLIAKWPGELSRDISPMPACTRPNYLESCLFPSWTALTYIEAYIGGKGAQFPVLHYDGLHTHAFLMQLYGVKQYLAFPPDQAEYLYPRDETNNISRIPDIENVDLSRFPLVAQAQGSRFELRAGETLFVPAGWWHTARLLTTSITTSINGVSAVNWSNFRRDYCAQEARNSRLQATLKAPYLSALGFLLSIF